MGRTLNGKETCECCVQGRIPVLSHCQTSVRCGCCHGTGYFHPTLLDRIQAFWRHISTDYYKVE